MKRVLIFSLAYLPHVGGAEVAVKEITDRLSASNAQAGIDPGDIEFHLITLRMSRLPREERIGNVRVYRIGNGMSLLSKFWFQFAAASAGSYLHRQYRFDAVWAVMAHSAGVPATLFNYIHQDIPYVLTLQEGDPPDHIERTMRPLWPLFARAFTKPAVVTAISHFLGDWARRRGFEGPLEIIPNGVNGRAFSAEIPLEEKYRIRRTFGIRESDTLLVTASRLVRKNGIDLVIRALANLPLVKFLVFGDGPERGALKLLAEELGVEERVIWAGHINNADLPAYLQTSDIFIRASRSEGQGNAFIEAMAAGIPVVGPRVGGISDFLFDEQRNPEHEPTGFAIEPESPASIVEVVQKIIDDPSHAHQIAINAQRMVLKEYDWDKIASEMRERVFNKVLS